MSNDTEKIYYDDVPSKDNWYYKWLQELDFSMPLDFLEAQVKHKHPGYATSPIYDMMQSDTMQSDTMQSDPPDVVVEDMAW